jgi:broad specificity phosphatase PhoE
MTRVILIKAGPTPWDLEKRIAGNQSLPLADEAHDRIARLIETLPPMDALYYSKNEEACHQVAKMVSILRKLKPRGHADLEAWSLGLWQGLRMDDLRQRYPTVLQQWEDAPETVVPPEGELFGDAIERLRGAIRKILRRNRQGTTLLSLRPSAFQIISGILHKESLQQIAARLQNDPTIETIEAGEEI